MESKIRLGVSSCLLGEPVRFDGGHKHDRYLTGTLGRYVEFVPVCPEVELGLPTPRETLRLVGSSEDQRLVFSKSGEDITDRMTAWSDMRVRQLEQENLSGFIFKSRSPSSGMARVKLYDQNGSPNPRGVGVFARIFMEHFPTLPVEEDGRLHDPRLRECFIEAIFVFGRWRKLLEEGLTIGRLVDFHTRHKLLILSHSVETYREMGRLVAAAKTLSLKDLGERYQTLLMKAMRLKSTPAKNINVLMHALGYFKKELTADEKQEVLEQIENYRQGHFPLIVAVTLLNHFIRKYDKSYLRDQFYFAPHPLELQLRNHV
ncbi:MAG: DUF1722 domain-containing protein [Desulfuromonas sp.]|jgi:uncharacterized protein YbgA (DUF1722 family)/uncharacterized protein YbbK (DUF523 family)|nr:MAG: DUF1722 domain-containing protein [Desulfuromonas sp.]